MKKTVFLLGFVFLFAQVFAQQSFNGLDMNLGNLSRLSNAKNPINKS